MFFKEYLLALLIFSVFIFCLIDYFIISLSLEFYLLFFFQFLEMEAKSMIFGFFLIICIFKAINFLHTLLQLYSTHFLLLSCKHSLIHIFSSQTYLKDCCLISLKWTLFPNHLLLISSLLPLWKQLYTQLFQPVNNLNVFFMDQHISIFLCM